MPLSDVRDHVIRIVLLNWCIELFKRADLYNMCLGCMETSL